MSGERRFPYEKLARLEGPEREGFQPAAALVDLIAPWSPREILDLGVGAGYYALPLATRLPGARVTGLDIEPRMLEVFLERAAAAGLAESVRPLESGVEQVPLPASSMDVILMVNLYHELDDRRAALAEARRILTPGGHLVVCDWDPASAEAHGPPRDHRVPRPTAEAELTAAGFRSVQAHPVYEPLYTLTAEAAAS